MFHGIRPRLLWMILLAGHQDLLMLILEFQRIRHQSVLKKLISFNLLAQLTDHLQQALIITLPIKQFMKLPVISPLLLGFRSAAQ